MSSQSDLDPSLWKILFWLVLAMLIGVLLLYAHHSDIQKAAFAEARSTLADTRARLADAGSALDETSAEAQDAAKQVAQLKTTHTATVKDLKDKHAATIDDLKATHAQATQQLEEAHADTLASMKAAHASALDGVTQALEQEKQQRTAQADQLSELKQAKTELEQNLEQIRKEDSALRDKLVDLTEEKHELEAKLEADNETIAGLNFELNTANQLEAALRDKLKRGAARQERLQTLVDKEEAAILDLQDKLVALTREREQLMADNDADASATGETTIWKAELERSQVLLQELQAELDQAVEERKAAEQQLAEIPSPDQVTAAEEAEAARQRTMALEAEKASLQSELDSANARTEEMESNVEALRAELEAAQATKQGTLADTSAELERLKPELDALTKARDEAEAAATAAQQALEEQKAALAETRQAMEEEQQSLQAQLDAAHKAQNQAQQEVERRAAGAEDADTKLAELNETIARLRQELADTKAGAEAARKTQGMYVAAAPLGGQITENGILLSLAGDELRFPSGTATLPEGDLPSLDRIADFLKGQSQLDIRIEGHTDSSGGADINRSLSQQRAEAVMQALSERGVDAERITAQGIGEDRPIASNDTEQGRRANRRVEVYAIQPE